MLRLSVYVTAVTGAFTALTFLSSVAAGTFGSGTFGTCQFGSCSITLATNGAVSLDITPTPSGRCTTQSDSVLVTTDNSSGYTLTISSSTENTNLLNGSETIAASSATVISPTALANNRWGFRVDGQAGFGSGPTTAATNATPSGLTYAGIVPSTSTAATLKVTDAPATPSDATTVWYSVCADTDTVSGSYGAEAMYTAVTN